MHIYTCSLEALRRKETFTLESKLWIKLECRAENAPRDRGSPRFRSDPEIAQLTWSLPPHLPLGLCPGTYV